MPRNPSRSTTPPRRVATQEERHRVLAAYECGDDWLTVAKYNNISRAATYRLVKTGDPSPPACGGARVSVVKFTDEMVEAMEAYLDEDCTLTLERLAEKVELVYSVKLSTSTISAKLASKLFTVKQIRKEPSTCNNDVNKTNRYKFAKKLVDHQDAGNYIVYYDETNYNLFCTPKDGRLKANVLW